MPNFHKCHALVAVLALLILGACGSSASRATSPSTPSSIARTEHVAAPLDDTISESTRMICADEGQNDIAGALGVKATQPLAPTWIDHEYSCVYRYRNGSMRLSVKQFADQASTTRYFTQLGARFGVRQRLAGLGQGAFTTAKDSVVVTKDEKVLVVDAQGLPARFGVPSDTRANVAISVAATIMGCWTGA